MKVIKFGSSAVATAQKIKASAQIVASHKGENNIIVVSSVSGTTDCLIEIADYLYKKNHDGAKELINNLERSYLNLAAELFNNKDQKSNAEKAIANRFDEVRNLSQDIFTLFEEKRIVAQGELLIVELFTEYLRTLGLEVKNIPALSVMRIDKNEEPDTVAIKKNLENQLEILGKADVYITEGFICKNAYNEIDNLKKGGSDYTASLIGAALHADEIQIWSDRVAISKIDNCNEPVERLNFEEAAELAYFSAKALHPVCLTPAKLENIPVRLINANKPEEAGTLISTAYTPNHIEVIAAKDGITSIRIKSSRMLFAHGFLRRVFEVFEQYKTSIDMITTSEIGVNVTIDNEKNLDEIVDDLKKFGTVTTSRNMSIICAVGDLTDQHIGVHTQIIEALSEVPITMISYGASAHNISFLIHTADKEKAMEGLKKKFF
ncbi:MAG: aspartate kinase [Paludibacteraceae bacterium]|nr:aspartate kinase [Candidatus Physcocola equi]MCQ2233978.1 aspartate kinase [Paludibacteraceae bacterium]